MVTEKKVNDIAKSMHIDLLKKGEPTYLNASGMSMYPFVRDDDEIKVLPVAEKDLSIGDVLVVDQCRRDDGWFYAHRLVSIKTNGQEKAYFTKGDWTRGRDEAAPFSKIMGKVVEIKRQNQTINLSKIQKECFILRLI